MAWLRTRERKSGRWFYVVTGRKTIAAGQQHSVALEILEEAKRQEAAEWKYRWPEPCGDPTGVVYVIAADSGEIKIGYSSGDGWKRLRALQTSCPMGLKILFTFSANRGDERRLHSYFKSSRIRGEWYRLSAEIRVFISDVERELLAARAASS